MNIKKQLIELEKKERFFREKAYELRQRRIELRKKISKERNDSRFDEATNIVQSVLRCGKSYQDVADSLGVSALSVKQRVCRTCEKINPEVYKAGKNRHNPPLLTYLRSNVGAFGF